MRGDAHGPALTPRRRWLAAAAVVALAVVAYWPARDNGFIHYDDDPYVARNPHVLGGLTADGLRWAFSTTETGNWHPLTWISHMVDCEWYGADPAGHHLTSLLLHALNALLVVVALYRLTGAWWRSAAVGALFAVHPLNVESVAWVAERKNLLCACFWLAATIAYAGYRRRPGPGRYLAVTGWFALALLSKPMAVTLPFVLLLIDVWPGAATEAGARDERAPGSDAKELRRRVLEKVPWILMSSVSGAITLVAQRAGGAVSSLTAIPAPARIANALVGYVHYVAAAAWPARLAVFYPHPGAAFVAWRAVGAAALLVAATVLAFHQRKRRPYLLFGWLWYLGTLAPVIGIVQVGDQAVADRYAYLPLIGVFVAVAWALADWAEGSPARRRGAAAAIVVLLLAWTAATRRELRYWHDPLALFERALRVTANNYVAHHEVGAALLERGDVARAVEQFEASVRISPRAEAFFSLGQALERAGDPARAEESYRAAIRIRPGLAAAHVNLGTLLYARGRVDDAIAEYTRAIAIRPDALAYFNLGVVQQEQGRRDEAARAYREALRLDPSLEGAKRNLAAIDGRRGGAQ